MWNNVSSLPELGHMLVFIFKIITKRSLGKPSETHLVQDLCHDVSLLSEQFAAKHRCG